MRAEAKVINNCPGEDLAYPQQWEPGGERLCAKSSFSVFMKQKEGQMSTAEGVKGGVGQSLRLY